MKEIIAMHGWGGDSNRWKPWIEVFQQDGWRWQNGERGYGAQSPNMPEWQTTNDNHFAHQRVVICHSLGSHLIDYEVIQKATHVVLLSSFSRFIPEGKENRILKTALQGMKKAIGTNKEKAMFLNFLKKATKPHDINSLPNNPIKDGLSKDGRKKLQNDLQLLINTQSLSPGFPTNAKVLVINGNHDEILSPLTKKILMKDLIDHLQTPPLQWNLNNEGHALLDMQLITKVKEWLG